MSQETIYTKTNPKTSIIIDKYTLKCLHKIAGLKGWSVSYLLRWFVNLFRFGMDTFDDSTVNELIKMNFDNWVIWMQPRGIKPQDSENP